MAPTAGLEPATHGLEGRCSIQMSYAGSKRWRRWGSNPRQPACKAGALPTELRPRISWDSTTRYPSTACPYPWWLGGPPGVFGPPTSDGAHGPKPCPSAQEKRRRREGGDQYATAFLFPRGGLVLTCCRPASLLQSKGAAYRPDPGLGGGDDQSGRTVSS
jgi:hypothetical protein